MNQMQQMLMQAQKMQREMAKANAALDEKEFKVSKNGMVELTITGNNTIKALDIDADALDPENKEMLEEAIKMAFEEALKQIAEERAEIEEKITGRAGGFGF
ncbi:MAG: YbaB/EbfC family nucleoid-associated protein [Candidatus Enteromonas sp.]|jgi:DNA-binding YbaB/EbfC family protein|nr:YbaB/EbfC family nucleoid-associated protein [Bacilli bacterium]MEE3298945.1 YbaB/EbfC family nucleoid-associated protein [Candidatus Enteromonas sp.]MBQ4182028.1 YbaB/EbfC family nucleoid-associated protein [Bacilli bacterium]MEE3402131.1 YbaB/EbfC family nucleoid-associated protein [Candidatus Enteromonas sp.]MEE3426531.1 YbaB/EbfC family nucleoid-associated protein [Candidatus Enteromonas sp.]